MSNTPNEISPIPVGSGKFFKVKRLRAVFNVTDADGNLFESDGITQSPDSVFELSAEKLYGLESAVSQIIERIYVSESEEE